MGTRCIATPIVAGAPLEDRSRSSFSFSEDPDISFLAGQAVKHVVEEMRKHGSDARTYSINVKFEVL